MPSYFDFLTEYEPVDVGASGFDDGFLIRPAPEGDALLVGYVFHDDLAGSINFWDPDENENGQFREARGPEVARRLFREELAASAAEQRIPSFAVERYDHDSVHYSLAKTRNYPDRTFDTVVCGLYTPPEDLHESFMARFEESGRQEEVWDRYRATCNRILDEFSAWANGETYSFAIERWEMMDGDPRLPARTNALSEDPFFFGTFYGWSAAEAALKEEMEGLAAPSAPEQGDELPSPSPS